MPYWIVPILISLDPSRTYFVWISGVMLRFFWIYFKSCVYVLFFYVYKNRKLSYFVNWKKLKLLYKCSVGVSIIKLDNILKLVFVQLQ